MIRTSTYLFFFLGVTLLGTLLLIAVSEADGGLIVAEAIILPIGLWLALRGRRKEREDRTATDDRPGV